MGFTEYHKGPIAERDIQGHLKAVENAIRKQLKDTTSSFELGLTRGDLNVSIEMDPVDGRVRVSIRQYNSQDQDNPGSETKKGFVVDLNMRQLPDIKPGGELTRLIPENTELAERMYGPDLWKNQEEAEEDLPS